MSDAAPSPFERGTHIDPSLAPARPFPAELKAELGAAADDHPFGELESAAAGPPWLTNLMRLIRPLCVGALMAIPTVGPASVGLVAAFDEPRALAMVRASTSFLHGIPSEIVLLIGALASGYGLARSVEKLRRAPPFPPSETDR